MEVSREYAAAARVLDVALAGTLEDLGFVRDGPSTYLLDLGELSWRVLFGPEYLKIPGTFREATGVYIPEYERIFLELFPERRRVADRLLGTRHRAHVGQSIIGAYDVSYFNSFHDEIASWPWPIRVLYALGLARRDMVSPKSLICDCPWIELHPDSYEEYVVTDGFDVTEIGRTLDEVWRTYVWPQVTQASTVSGVVDMWFSERRDPVAIDRAILCWIGGDRAGCERVIQRRIDRETDTNEDIRKAILKRKTERRTVRRNPMELEKSIAFEKDMIMTDAHSARRLAAILGLKI